VVHFLHRRREKRVKKREGGGPNSPNWRSIDREEKDEKRRIRFKFNVARIWDFGCFYLKKSEAL
jgi:hypothetical protein